MTSIRTPGATALAVLLLTSVVAACGSATTSSAQAGATTGNGTAASAAANPTTAAAATDAPAATEAGAASAVASEPASGGGGSAASTCGLVTTSEVEGIFGVTGVSQHLIAGPPDTCDYQLADAPFLAMVLTNGAASYVYDAMAGDPASTSVGGIGDKAVYNSSQLVLVVLKGENLLTVSVLDESRSEEERQQLMEQVAKVAVGRM